MRPNGRRSLLDDAEAFPPEMERYTWLGVVRVASGEREFFPLGLDGMDLSVVTYEAVGDDRAESTSEGARLAP